MLSGPDDPSWNGLTVPYDQQYASYTNQLRSYGGSAKLEWRSSDDQFYVSLLGFARRRYEISTMNKQDLYTKSAVYDQTGTAGASRSTASTPLSLRPLGPPPLWHDRRFRVEP
jgi:hypothetical protein